MKVHGVFLVAIFFYLAYTHLVNGQPHKDCQTRCGNVTIYFKLTCNDKEKLLFGRDFEVINISHSGELRVWNNVSYACDNSTGNLNDGASYIYTQSNLSLSRNNKFTVVGCNALALLMTYGTRNHSAVCLSTCNGEGCCSTDVFVPLDSNKFHTLPTRVPNMTSVYDFNPCKYAFLAENGTFHFNASEDLKNLRNVKEFPVLLDWSIGNQRCDQVGNRSICGMNNSICVNSTRGTGYNCKCLEGFEGNPYLSNEKGCQGTLHTSMNVLVLSINITARIPAPVVTRMEGGFYCKCRSGYRLDTTTMSCKRKDFGWATILLGTTIGFLSIMPAVSCVRQKMKHRKDSQLRQKFFVQNGGGFIGFETRPSGFGNMTVMHDFNPCKYAFLAENGTFHFNASEDLKNLRNVKEFPVLLDWSIGNQRCDQVGNRSICGMNNSICVNSTRGTGYNCKCLEGFEGNPYLSNEKGCQDTTTMSCKRKDFGWATILLAKHQWSDQYPGDETENLVGVGVLSAQGDTSSTGYDSIKNVASMQVAAGR
ncbi:hypothetical protein Bca52824_076559 [Brassica carinata]|uniref:EGF-like domain-containing protein n=1 Tax=Brassica carinata TaxID=52824 RepID=A0A8X7TWG3_BRACI|nr:hypothetical protein Bca52824_076559 [Brassica carinata]